MSLLLLFNQPSVARTGSLSVVLDAVGFSGVGASLASGSLSAMLDPVSLAGSGIAPASGALSSTLDSIVLLGYGAAIAAGQFTSTLDAVILAGIGIGAESIPPSPGGAEEVRGFRRYFHPVSYRPSTTWPRGRFGIWPRRRYHGKG